jgi:hypothetical protein
LPFSASALFFDGLFGCCLLGFFSFSPLPQHGLFCDCNNRKTMTTKTKACTMFANYFVCVITKNCRFVFATILRAWVQPEVICGRTMAGVCVVEVAWLFGYLWLQVWVVCNCNSKVSCDCKKRHAQCFRFNYFSVLSLQKKMVILWLQKKA